MSLANKAGTGRRIVEALVEFEAKPGRYSLVMREPGVLFDHTRAVLALALGRAVPEMGVETDEASQVQSGARFFVRAALLRNGADHYTTLGLWPGFSDNELRDHYRLLMRLTHPDFVGNDPSWPADAATRVNKAYEVLSSPVKKAEYDQSLKRTQTAQMPAWHARPQSHPQSPYAGAGATPARVWVGVVAVGAVILAGWAALHDWSDPVEVVSMNMEELTAAAQKAPVPKPLPEPAQVPVALPAPPPPPTPATPEPVVAAAQAPDPVLPPTMPPAPPPQAVAQAPVADPAELRRQQARQERLERQERLRLEKLERQERLKQEKLQQEADRRRAAALAKVQPPVPVAAPVTAALAAAPVAAPPAPVAAVAPVPTLPVATAPAPSTAPAARLVVADVQPVFLTLLQAMQTGNPEAIARGLDRSVRQSEGTAHLLRVYKHLIGEATAIRVGQVQLRGKPEGEQLVIDGVIQLLLPEAGGSTPVRELRMRAVFARQAGQIVVTHLAAGS